MLLKQCHKILTVTGKDVTVNRTIQLYNTTEFLVYFRFQKRIKLIQIVKDLNSIPAVDLPMVSSRHQSEKPTGNKTRVGCPKSGSKSARGLTKNLQSLAIEKI